MNSNELKPFSDCVIEDSVFGWGHGLSIGSMTAGGLHNITVQNIRMHGTESGFKIKSYLGGGGDISGVRWRNVSLSDVDYPISMSQTYPARCEPHCNASFAPRYNISVRGMHATGIKKGGGPSFLGYPNASGARPSIHTSDPRFPFSSPPCTPVLGAHIFADIADSSFEGPDGVTWTCSHADVTTEDVTPTPKPGACTA